jgi:hypothetical protein
MSAIAGLFVLLLMAGAAFLVLAFLGLILKVAFKVVLIPVALVFGAVKVVLALVGAVVGLVFVVMLGPVLLVVAIALLPLALLAGLAWGAVHAVA